MKGPAAMETGFQNLLHSRLHMEGDSEREKRRKQEGHPNPGETTPQHTFWTLNPSRLIYFMWPLGALGSRQDLWLLLMVFLTISAPLDTPERVASTLCQAFCRASVPLVAQTLSALHPGGGTALPLRPGGAAPQTQDPHPIRDTRSACGWCGSVTGPSRPCRTAKPRSAPSRKRRGRRSARKLPPACISPGEKRKGGHVRGAAGGESSA